MASKWEMTTLGQIAAPTPRSVAMGPFGSNIKKDNYKPFGVPVIRGFNLATEKFYNDDFVFLSEAKADELKGSNAFSDDIVFTAQGTVGQVGIVPKGSNYSRYVLSQNLMKITCDKDKAVPLFVFYYFRSAQGQHEILSRVNPTGVPCISQPLTSLKSFRIPLPTLEDQQSIARILGTLDDKIELNRRMNETLEAMARALFKSWFVDFDPVRAKAEQRQPAGMDAETAALFPSSFEASPLGQIPKGWRANTLAEIVEINSWTLNKRDELERVEYIEISEVMRGDVLNVQEFVRGQEPSRARRRLRHGDTIISTVRPDRGAYFLCLNPSPHLIASTGFAVLTPIKAPWSFVYSAATQPEIFPYLGRLADGGAYPAISPEAICKWEIAVPCESQILAKYQELCASLFELSVANRVNSRTLAALRDALLPKLLSGEIRVCQAESLIAEAV